MRASCRGIVNLLVVLLTINEVFGDPLRTQAATHNIESLSHRVRAAASRPFCASLPACAPSRRIRWRWPSISLVFAHEGGQVFTCGADSCACPSAGAVFWSGACAWRSLRSSCFFCLSRPYRCAVVHTCWESLWTAFAREIALLKRVIVRTRRYCFRGAVLRCAATQSGCRCSKLSLKHSGARPAGHLSCWMT